MPQSIAPASSTPRPVNLRRLCWSFAALILIFSVPLLELARFSFSSDLFSHVLLIPVISFYVIWHQRANLPSITEPHRPLAVFFGIIAAILLALYVGARISIIPVSPVDAIALSTLSFVFYVATICLWQLGRPWLRDLAFPLGFLLFMVPFPTAMESAIETVLQHGSAAVAHFLFNVAGTSVFADGLIFQLPGITLQVAPECSGIHSSLALLITSIVTGHLVLRSPGRRAMLALAVIPLSLLRNGFRVFVIGELCVHISPDMIHSYIHHHGGPIFFTLSLIPFFLLLFILVRSERKARPEKP